MFKNHVAMYGRTFPERPWWQAAGGVPGNVFRRSDGRFILDLGWSTTSTLSMVREVVRGEDESVLDEFPLQSRDFAMNLGSLTGVGRRSTVSSWEYAMLGVRVVGDRPKVMQVALEEIDAVDRKWPVPRPAMEVGQVWATPSGSEHLVLHGTPDGKAVGVGGISVMFGKMGRALSPMSWMQRRELDPRTPVPSIPGVPLDSPEGVQAYVSDVRVARVESDDPLFVALLHGPSPWGRDVPWCDVGRVPAEWLA